MSSYSIIEEELTFVKGSRSCDQFFRSVVCPIQVVKPPTVERSFESPSVSSKVRSVYQVTIMCRVILRGAFTGAHSTAVFLLSSRICVRSTTGLEGHL